jgi:glutathione S-transferase
MTWTQWPALITWLTVLLLVAVAFDVGRARARYGIRAPATTGNEQFERVFRVQMNTMESAMMFLPALWLAALYWKPAWASVCGALWLAGRIWYARAYAREPGRRSGGYTLSSIATSVLIIGAAIGWIRAAAWT